MHLAVVANSILNNLSFLETKKILPPERAGLALVHMVDTIDTRINFIQNGFVYLEPKSAK